LLVGHQRQRQAALWVRLTDDDLYRINGSSSLQPDMEPLPDVVRELSLTAEQLRTEVQTGRLLPYRLRIKNRWRWYILRRCPDA
jgi:hypothetical protein